MFPVLRLGVVGAEHDDDHVWRGLERVLIGLLVPVGIVALFQKRAPADAEISDFPLVAEHRLELGGIGLARLRARTLSDAIADAGDVDWRFVAGGFDGVQRPGGVGVGGEKGGEIENAEFHGDGETLMAGGIFRQASGSFLK